MEKESNKISFRKSFSVASLASPKVLAWACIGVQIVFQHFMADFMPKVMVWEKEPAFTSS